MNCLLPKVVYFFIMIFKIKCIIPYVEEVETTSLHSVGTSMIDMITTFVRRGVF